MAQKQKNKRSLYARSPLLRKVGIWATIWWAVSGLYLILLLWVAKDYYIEQNATTIFSRSTWYGAVLEAKYEHPMLIVLFWLIVLVWIIGTLVWLKALKDAKISYKAGFKDLFGTLR